MHGIIERAIQRITLPPILCLEVMKDIEIESISYLHVPVCSDWQEEIWRCSILGITHFLGKHSPHSQSFIIKVSQCI